MLHSLPMASRIEKNPPWRIAGTMSGTSMDGVDVAVIETDGEHVFRFFENRFRPYSPKEQNALRSVLGAWPGEAGVDAATEIVENAHIDALEHLDVDLIGFHGQTIAHDPAGKGTHQIGSGSKLAEHLRLPVVWGFREKDVQLGGQGAPLAPFYHFALAKRLHFSLPLAFLNLGGVGNITYVDPRHDGPLEDGAILAFDTGPANAPINDLLFKRRGKSLDKDGALAKAGHPDAMIVASLLDDPYFREPAPKSLDRDRFASAVMEVGRLSDENAAATLTLFSALSVVHSLHLLPMMPEKILVTGGGRRNPALIQALRGALPCKLEPVEAFGLDGDMIEAQAFAFLAARCLRDLPLSSPMTTGIPKAASGGRVSRPSQAETIC